MPSGCVLSTALSDCRTADTNCWLGIDCRAAELLNREALNGVQTLKAWNKKIATEINRKRYHEGGSPCFQPLRTPIRNSTYSAGSKHHSAQWHFSFPASQVFCNISLLLGRAHHQLPERGQLWRTRKVSFLLGTAQGRAGPTLGLCCCPLTWLRVYINCPELLQLYSPSENHHREAGIRHFLTYYLLFLEWIEMKISLLVFRGIKNHLI